MSTTGAQGMVTRILSSVGMAVLAALLTGCAGNTYLDAKRNTAAGGQLERDTAAAQSDLDAARARNAQLQTDQARVAGQIEQDRRRISALEGDLGRQQAALDAARKSGKLSQARHAQLKRELDALRADTQAAELANRSRAVAKAPDPQADAAKQAQLRELERRKKALETALAAMSK